MFTLHRKVKRSVAERVPDRASVHARNAAFKAVSAPEQYCPTPLLKVKRSVSDRFWNGPSQVWTLLSEQKLQRNLVLANDLFKSKGSAANCMTDRGSVHTGNASEQFLHCNRTANSYLHCTGTTSETEQKPVQYSVNIALVRLTENR